MMVWLDTKANSKGKPNENFARELLELFSLGLADGEGKPTFTETDVREVARAFTGWGLEPSASSSSAPTTTTPGMKTIFGKTGPFNGEDVIELIVPHPAAGYLCRRLFEFFVHPDPAENVLSPCRGVHPPPGAACAPCCASSSPPRPSTPPGPTGPRPRRPVEFAVGAVRALGVATDGFNSPG